MQLNSVSITLMLGIRRQTIIVMLHAGTMIPVPNIFLTNYCLGGGHLHVQQHEGESNGVPGQVCPEWESGTRRGHQGVLSGEFWQHFLSFVLLELL